jgi:signal transduction histidine kinase
MAASTIEECDRLLEMINTMLMISKTEAGAGQLERRK